MTALADAWGVPLRLVVEPVRGDQDVDPARLIRWYARHAIQEPAGLLRCPHHELARPVGGSGGSGTH
ncbi:hypothetical protein [Actinomadura sp. 3N508]|uniref:hypothetical protein n=1 Tax=Actinomadura sp. 3N508 TaxID=3375153 RepID=UPI0037A76DAB